MAGYSPRESGQPRPQICECALLKRGRVERDRDRVDTTAKYSANQVLRIARLEHELIALREHLQITTRDLAVASAAAKVSEKDARTAHEGCRSLNYELARAREKLQLLRLETETVSARREEAVLRFAGLTARQRQIMDLVLAGNPSKNIAADLDISQRTVDNHRAAIMRKTGSKSIPALIRTAVTAI